MEKGTDREPSSQTRLPRRAGGRLELRLWGLRAPGSQPVRPRGRSDADQIVS